MRIMSSVEQQSENSVAAKPVTVSGTTVTIDMSGRPEWKSTPAQVALIATKALFMSSKDASMYIVIGSGINTKAKDNSQWRKDNPKVVTTQQVEQ